MSDTLSPAQQRDARARVVDSLRKDGLNADRAHSLAGEAEYRMINGRVEVAFHGGDFSAIGAEFDEPAAPPAYDAAAAGKAAGERERAANRPNPVAFT